MAKTLKNNNHRGAEIGAGALAAAALAVAGGYVLWEKMGKQKQAKVKAWVAKARKESVRNLAHAKRIGEAEYKRIVDAAVKRYGAGQGINKEELAKVADDLRAERTHIRSQAQAIMKKGQKQRPRSRKDR